MAEGIVQARQVYRDENGVPTLGVTERLTVTQQAALSAPTGEGTPPGITTKASISGTAESGEVLTLAGGVHTGSPVVTQKWLRDGVAISGATAATYTLVAGDVGKMISVEVTLTGTYATVLYRTNALGPIGA